MADVLAAEEDVFDGIVIDDRRDQGSLGAKLRRAWDYLSGTD